MEAQEARAKLSSGGAAGASRPPFICSMGVDAVASMHEGQVNFESHQFHCSTGITAFRSEDSDTYMVSRYWTVGWESRASVMRPYAHCKSGFRGSTWFTLMTVSGIRWCSRMGALCRSNGRPAQ